MKALIWFACFFVLAFVQMLIKDTGIILGGIPTALLAALTLWIANKLCDRYDIHLLAKKAKAKGLTVNELVKKVTPEEILDHCESIKDRKELKHYLEQQLEWGTITKQHMKILYDHYK